MNKKEIYEGKEYYEKIKTLKQVKYFPARWITFYLDERTGEKWVHDRPDSELQGGGLGRLTLVENFPDLDIFEKDEYIGQEVFIMVAERLELIKKNEKQKVRYYLDKKTGQKWIEDYISNLQTDGNLSPRLRKLEKFPWGRTKSTDTKSQ